MEMSQPHTKTPPTPATWKEVLSIVTIFDTICSHLAVPDILALRRTSTAFQSLYASYYRRVWSHGLNRRLQRFVDKPEDFRSQMGKLNVVISGSFALQFFDRSLWEESDLDLFVKSEKDANAFAEYLCTDEGYCENEDQENLHYLATHLISVRTYLRTRKDGSKSKVQVIRTRATPICSILQKFYTTALINIITWNKAYSIFPHCVTDYKSYDLALPYSPEYYAGLAKKYKGRGWEMLHELRMEDVGPARSLAPLQTGQPPGPPGIYYDGNRYRRVGDIYTWQVHLDTRGIELAITPDSVIEYAQFFIGRTRHNSDRSKFKYYIGCSTFSSCSLRYMYTFPNDFKSKHLSFWRWAGGKLENLTEQELLKFDESERPVPFDTTGTLHYFIPGYGVYKDDYPQGWIFYDDHVPQWYEEWEQAWEAGKRFEFDEMMQ